MDIYDDFSEGFELLTRMIQTIGTADSHGNIWLDKIPEEVNITVDGERLSYIYMYKDASVIGLEFGNYCYGALGPTSLSLSKF